MLGGGSSADVPDESTSEEDEAFERRDADGVTLYKVSDANGALQVDTISTKPIRQEMLKREDCFILDTGSALYVWVGRGATQAEKTQSVVRAQSKLPLRRRNRISQAKTFPSDFIQTKKYPAWTPVHRVVEGAESAPFKQYFATWRDAGMQHTRLIRAANEDSDSGLEEEVDANVLRTIQKSAGRAVGFMPDDGTGEIEVYRILEKEPILEDKLGVFFGSSCYVIKYQFTDKNGADGYVLYYWQVVILTEI